MIPRPFESCLIVTALLACSAGSARAAGLQAAPIPDPRHLANGWKIPSEGYADQPYIVKTDDGGRFKGSS